MRKNLLQVFQSEAPRILRNFDRDISVSAACDCACSRILEHMPEIPPSVSHEQPEVFFRTVSPFLRTIPLFDGAHLGYLFSGIGISQGTVVLNHTANDMLSRFQTDPLNVVNAVSDWRKTWGADIVNATLLEFVRLGFLVNPQKANELIPPVDEQSSLLSVWLHITEQCNLRCSTCYLAPGSAKMSLETGKAAIDAIVRSARRHGYRQIKLKYAGGEPLLRFHFLLKLHQYARTRSNQCGIELDGIVLSNGTLLTGEMFAQMDSIGLRLMISLDALPSKMDGELCSTSQRCYADGHDSSSQALQAIESALQHGIVPEISVTVSGQNIGDLPQVMQWVVDRDLPFGLNFYRNHERSCTAKMQLEQDTIIQGMLNAYKVIENSLPRRSLLASLLDRANLSSLHHRTCGVGQDYFAIDCFGNISQCQMNIAHPLSSISTEDPLEMIRTTQFGIQNRSVDEKEGCRQCDWRYYCAGGCPLETYRAVGRYDVRSPHCDLYKALLPEVLRLEGLRILKYAALE